MRLVRSSFALAAFAVALAASACNSGIFDIGGEGCYSQCYDGSCLSESALCDGTWDCDDGSDEASCGSCTSDQYACGDGECIPRSYLCDGGNDCYDGADESGCSGSCGTDQYRCADGECIPQSYLCDGGSDCYDGADEAGCSTCDATEFACSNGNCVPLGWRCDGASDCTDGSDEDGCTDEECSAALLYDETATCDSSCDTRVNFTNTGVYQCADYCTPGGTPCPGGLTCTQLNEGSYACIYGCLDGYSCPPGLTCQGDGTCFPL